LNECFQAQSFASIIQLSRFADLVPLQVSKGINWTATWALLHFAEGDYSSTLTSFECSNICAFNLKLMANELPLLHKLQSVRRPDLYSSDWLCPSYNTAPETWFHLWHCPAYSDIFKTILGDTLRKLFNLLPSSTKHSSKFHDSWSSLWCWKFPDPMSPSSFSFETLFREFVPSELFTITRSCFNNNKETVAAILSIISEARSKFKSDIWKTRNLHMSSFERAHNITEEAKQSKRIFSSAQSTSLRPLDQRWRKWIANSIITNKPWQGFPQRINSLFALFIFCFF
jgi:hypothetical protein